jgi:hypothetical protein
MVEDLAKPLLVGVDRYVCARDMYGKALLFCSWEVGGAMLCCALLCVAGCAGCAGGDGLVCGLRSRPVMDVYMYTYVCLWMLMVDWYS